MANREALNILITCIGRRVSLLESFRQAAEALGLDCRIFGADRNELSAALQLCDGKLLVSPISSAAYIDELLKAVRENDIKLIVPTIDTDLRLLAENKERFAERSCCVLISSAQVVNICEDKRLAYKFLREKNFETPETMTAAEALEVENLSWPVLLKPWDGAAGKSVMKAFNRRELQFLAERVPNCMVQEFVQGTEFTCDVFVDFGMRVRCVVPRQRLEIRNGEVSKGRVVKDRDIIARAKQIVEALEAGPGVITVQFIKTSDGRLLAIDINPRFGGGVPLSIKAGGDFPKWILEELSGKECTANENNYEDGLTMLRYDAEVWLKS